MPANNHDSNKSNDDRGDTEVRPSWQDFNGNDDDEEEDHHQDTQPDATTPEERTKPDLPETHYELSETERQLINHAPGRSASNHSSRLAQKDKIRIAEQFCTRLGVTSRQTNEVKRLIATLNLDRFGNQKRIEKIALVLIRYIVDRDRMNQHGEEFRRLSSQREFKRILSEQELDLGDIMSISPRVKDAIQEIREGDDG